MVGCGAGRFKFAGNLKPAGKPPTAGPGDWAGGLIGPRLGWGVAGPCRANEKAFILAAISGFMGVGPPLCANVDPAGRRAASRVPRGVEEAVMFDILRGMLVSEAMRGGFRCVGLVGANGERDSSGDVGGEGESSGDSEASSAMVK